VRELEDLFLRLAPHGAVIEPLLTLAGAGRLEGLNDSRTLANRSGLGTARQPEVVEALQVAASVGAMARSGMDQWRIALTDADSRELASLLRGARLFRDNVYVERDAVQAVISMPAAPSRLVDTLKQSLQGVWGLETTEAVLGHMAAAARSRFTVMTPFVDADGAHRVIELFAATKPGVRRELIVRDGLPAPLVAYADEIRRLDLSVLDFRILRADRAETETFHAKVVRVDDNECYVGSSNMTRWSFGYSLELGMHVRGAAPGTISRVIDAVLAVSTRVVV
jgi:phosphatidylserine/phosphatidylglycerophosphate/cardiolipin synthase-like enzyme